MIFKRLIVTGMKRWVMLGISGISLLIFSATELLNIFTQSYVEKSFWIFITIVGITFICYAATEATKTIILLVNKGYFKLSYDSKKINNLIYENRLLISGPKIVTIGGGTGLSTMLRGLKYYTSNITAVVTVGDDGGGSGQLRQDLKMIPPGDIRNCILALADTEPIMEDLLQYRFTEGRLKGQSFGNLFLAAMHGMSNNFEEAVQKMSSVLAVTGKVLPVTLDDVVLKAKLKNGIIISGESEIPKIVLQKNSKIEKIFLKNISLPVEEVLNTIDEADAIILGPGSLYTSIIPNLIVKGVSDKIRKSNAIKIYVCNIMTQPGETSNYNVFNHIEAIIKHAGKGIIDYVAINTSPINDTIYKKYDNNRSKVVSYNKERINNMGIEVIEGNFVKDINGSIRHDTDELAKVLIRTIMEKKLLLDNKKILEYNFLSEKLRIKERD